MNPQTNSTLLKVGEVINRIIQIDDRKIVATANLKGDLGADSLANIEILMALEDAFEIEFSESSIAELKTVDDLIRYIDEQRSIKCVGVSDKGTHER